MYALALLLIPQLVAGLSIGTRGGSLRAAYFLDNNPAGASIVALEIGNNGTLSNPVRTATGGVGMFGLSAGANGTTPTAGDADTLFTQDAVVVHNNYLFTVNAGSNTVSMFVIDKLDPFHPKLLNSAPTLGTFPVSVAYSSKHKTACTINGGSVGGVSCYSVDHAKGLTPLGGLRSIDLGQTTPPVGPPGTVSDILFNPSQTALFATVKGSPTTPGKIFVYPVMNGSVSMTPIVSNPSGLLIDFSMSFLGNNNKGVITDPAYGASLVNIQDNFEVTVDKKVVVAGEVAVCWSQYSSRFNTVFLMDIGTSNLTLVDPASGVIKSTVVLSNSAAAKGSVDASLDRRFLYVLRSGPYISVMDNTGLNHGKIPSEIQTFDLTSLGSRQGFQGMAIYPS